MCLTGAPQQANWRRQLDWFQLELPRFAKRCWACGKSLELVTPLVIDWGQIVERGVAGMGVVRALDELEDCHACLALGFETATVEQFTFERGEETLAHGVIEAIANRAHRGPHVGLAAALAEGDRSVLATLV